MFEDGVELAVRPRFQLHDALDVDDGRAVHTDEARRVEPIHQLLE